MNQQEYIDAITSSITHDTVWCEDESELYAYLDEEMLKFGSLHESDLNWEDAEKAAISLLRDQCKHMRVLAHLIVCLQHSRDGERYLLSITLINEFLQNHWESALPSAGNAQRIKTIKQKILIQILQRSINFSLKLDLTDGDRGLSFELNKIVEQLKENVLSIGVEYDDFWKINGNFTKLLPEEKVA